MVPLRSMGDIDLCLLVFLCAIGRSLQGCADYLDNSSEFLTANFSPHQYIRLEGLPLNLASRTMNRTEVANRTTQQWCIQSGKNTSRQCNILHSCFNTSIRNLFQTRCEKPCELYPQKMEMVSMLQLYCMVNIVKNMTDFPPECKEGEKIYVCTLKPTEKTPTPSLHDQTTEAATTAAATEASTAEASTTAAATEASTAEASTTEAATNLSPTGKIVACGRITGHTQGCIASNVILAVLLVLLIGSNVAWCQNFQRQRRIYQKLGRCACTNRRDEHQFQDIREQAGSTSLQRSPRL